MTEDKNTEIVEVQPDLDRTGWGDRTEITTMGKRLSAMLPGVRNEQEALRLAQASILSRANPFRGEMYVFGDQIIEGYKLLIRWAKRQEDYTAKYTKLSDDDDNMTQVKGAEIGYICELWRDSTRSGLVEACKAGIPYEAAQEMFIPERAVGIVSHKDTYNSTKKYDIDPPKGWSWEQVAKKRALKNALNLAYGMPSPDELARESWEVDGQTTQAEDWQGVEELNPGDAAALAKDRAHWREHNEQIAASSEYAAKNAEQTREGIASMFPGTEVVDTVVVTPPEAEDPPEQDENPEPAPGDVGDDYAASLIDAGAFKTERGTLFSELSLNQLVVVTEWYSKLKATRGLTDDQEAHLRAAQLLRDDLKSFIVSDNERPF